MRESLSYSCVFRGLHKFPAEFKLGLVKETLNALFFFLTF